MRSYLARVSRRKISTASGKLESDRTDSQIELSSLNACSSQWIKLIPLFTAEPISTKPSCKCFFESDTFYLTKNLPAHSFYGHDFLIYMDIWPCQESSTKRVKITSTDENYPNDLLIYTIQVDRSQMELKNQKLSSGLIYN